MHIIFGLHERQRDTLAGVGPTLIILSVVWTAHALSCAAVGAAFTIDSDRIVTGTISKRKKQVVTNRFANSRC